MTTSMNNIKLLQNINIKFIPNNVNQYLDI